MEKAQPAPRRSFGIWLPETVALVFSFLCLAALAVLLAVYDGKPIFGWNGVTLNTIVSILSTSSKASLMLVLSESTSQWKWILFANERRPLMDFERIETASRGPLGSLKLMWNCKGATLLRIGALTTLLAVAVDPFAQQLVQLRRELDFVNDPTTTVARAVRYSKGNKVNMSQMLDPSRNPPRANTHADADFSMQSAVLYGLSQPLKNTMQQLPFNCPSGNCTWPDYESLAVCHTCNDVTSSLEQLTDMGAQYVFLMDDNDAAYASNGTAFRLPNGLFIDNLDGWQWGTTKHGSMMMTTFGTGNASLTNTMQSLDTLIWAVSLLKVSPDPSNSSATWPSLPVSATECALHYCVNRYSTTVRNGTLAQTITPLPAATRDPTSWDTPAFPASFTPLNATMHASIDFDEKFSCIARSDLALGESSGPSRYNISQTAVDSISAFFKKTFEMPLHRFTQELNKTADGQVNGWYMNTSQIQYQPSAIKPLFASADLNATFAGVAASMTNALREGADDGTVEEGQSGRMVTYYAIRWPWIALHCAVVVAGAVFLALTVRESGHVTGAAPVWKSSTLAAMSRSGQVAEVLGGAESVGEMERRAKEELVVLFGKDGEVLKDGSNIVSTSVRDSRDGV